MRNVPGSAAVMTITAADPALLAHEWPALVFDDIHDLAARVDAPDLDCDASRTLDVLVDDGELGARRAAWEQPASRDVRGFAGSTASRSWRRTTAATSFDFLRSTSGVVTEHVTYP